MASGLIDPLDAVHASDFADFGEDRFQLAAIGNFQAGFDAGVELVRAAFQIADIGAGSTDHRGDFGKQAGTILGANGQLHGESGSALATPFDGDAAFGLVHEIMHVRATASVNGDAASASDVTDNFVARNRVAALSPEHQQVVVAFYDQRGFAQAEHALDGLDQGGLGVVFRDLGRFGNLSQNFGQHLARGIF